LNGFHVGEDTGSSGQWAVSYGQWAESTAEEKRRTVRAAKVQVETFRGEKPYMFKDLKDLTPRPPPVNFQKMETHRRMPDQFSSLSDSLGPLFSGVGPAIYWHRGRLARSLGMPQRTVGRYCPLGAQASGLPTLNATRSPIYEHSNQHHLVSELDA
jgi:hypothetical protein